MGTERDLTTMNVSLPRAQKEFVDEQVQRGSFSTVSDYIRDLIRREQRAVAREEPELEQELLEGLNSGPATAMTQDDWQELRDGLRSRLIEGEQSGSAGLLDMAQIQRQARKDAGLPPS